MRLRRRRGGSPAGASGTGDEQRIGSRFVMRQKLFSFGDDFDVTDEQGRKVFKVDGKVFRGRDVVRLLDLLFVARDEAGELAVLELPGEERAGDGALLGALLGLDEVEAVRALVAAGVLEDTAALEAVEALGAAGLIDPAVVQAAAEAEPGDGDHG